MPTALNTFGEDRPITVYIYASDGTLVDVIDEVDLGDPIEAHERGRTSLKAAVLWGALAVDRYRASPQVSRRDSRAT